LDDFDPNLVKNLSGETNFMPEQRRFGLILHVLHKISIHEQYFERKFVDFDLFVHEIEDKILIIRFLKMTI